VPQDAPPPADARQSAREQSPIDFTGTWVSVVTEDWQWRFVTPIVGDYTGVPLNAEGDALARAWDPAADAKMGEQCKGFGAAGINRLPTRLRISWQDDETLTLEWDLGTQSRLASFNKASQAGARAYQGHAVAEWVDLPARGRGGRGGGAPAAGRGVPEGPGGPPPARAGGLKVVTTNLRPQYLRQNGVPVSEEAVVTEHLDIVPAPDGSEWLVVKTSVDDPAFLTGWYIVSSQFKKEPDDSKWNPTACEVLPLLKGTATQVPRRGGGE
jgi:hypothetical protein